VELTPPLLGRLATEADAASRRVAEKIGMHDEKTTNVDDYPAVIYTAERS
jgi:hypothetical protein